MANAPIRTSQPPCSGRKQLHVARGARASEVNAEESNGRVSATAEVRRSARQWRSSTDETSSSVQPRFVTKNDTARPPAAGSRRRTAKRSRGWQSERMRWTANYPTPLNSVLSSWPRVAGRPMVVGHVEGAGVSARRKLPVLARMYRLPGRRCQGCGLPVATKARAAAPVHLPECRSPSPWYVADP